MGDIIVISIMAAFSAIFRIFRAYPECDLTFCHAL